MSQRSQQIQQNTASAAIPSDTRRHSPAGLNIARSWMEVGLILIVTLAAYLPALRAGFVWDDETFLKSPLLLDAKGLYKIWFEPSSLEKEVHYWPITYTTFWIEHKIWGFNFAGYHFTNIMLHAVDCVLIWLILRRFYPRGALLSAILFALHPVHVESVAWMIERKDVLSTLFYLTCFMAFLHFDERRSWPHFALSVFLFVLGMLVKSVVITFPAAMLVWIWHRRGRIAGKDILAILPFLAIGAVMAYFDTRWAGDRGYYASGMTLVERLLVMARGIVFYPSKLLWPVNLIPIYARWKPEAFDLLWGLFVLVSISVPALLILSVKKFGRAPLAATFFYGITLSPTLGLIDHGFMRLSFAADRFQYLASLGWIALAGGAAAELSRHLPATLSRWRPVCAAAVLLPLGIFTARQCTHYADAETLFRYDLAKNPSDQQISKELASIFHDAGFYYASVGEWDKAIFHYRKALTVRPEAIETLNALGKALLQTGDLAGAEKGLSAALAVDPQFGLALKNLGDVRMAQGRATEAQDLFARAARAQSPLTSMTIGAQELGTKREDWIAARDKFFARVRQHDDDAAAFFFLGTAQLQLGNIEEAGDALERAMSLRPKFADAAYNLGIVRLLQQRDKECMDLFNQALGWKPELIGSFEKMKSGRK